MCSNSQLIFFNRIFDTLMPGKHCFKTLALTAGKLKDSGLFIYYFSVTAMVIYSMKMAAFKSVNFFLAL